ncbi:MAG: tetratricopeptide repeat protein, partial [Candidatus Obscuribacterales bacterium]|nr:tetratricopeptide repeat protein [Candidatus Obscuribacterales bacterium]
MNKILPKISSLALAAMIALAGVSCTTGCTFNDSQERQWAECLKRVCQALDGRQIEKAEAILQEELKRIEGSRKEFLESRCLSSLGKIYRYSGKVEKAVVPLSALVEMKEAISDKRSLGLPHDLVALAYCYIDEKKYDQAANLLLRAAVMEQTMSEDARLIPCLRQLARCFESLKKNDQAQTFYQLAIDADARQHSVPEEKRSDIVIYDEANLMWDYS